MEKTMRASQLIGVLLGLMAEHGDREIRVLRRSRDGDKEYHEINDYGGVDLGEWEEDGRKDKTEGFVIDEA
jgi:hypothetical protein